MIEPIARRTFDDPERARVQEEAIASATTRTEQHLIAYASDRRSFGGRYIAADLFKETFAIYAASKDARNRFNAPVHNAAAVLSAEQFRRVLSAPNEPLRDTVVLLTGIPGAGKTSTVLSAGALAPDYKAVFEGQMVKPESTFPKIQQVLDAGLKPVVIAVHTTPENALRNTFRRFTEEGRGASLAVMADIQGGLPDGLRAVHRHFGHAVELRVYDVRDRANPRELRGWESVKLLESEGNHERIAQRLAAELERARSSGRINDAAHRQALGQPPLAIARGLDGQGAGGREADARGRELSQDDRAGPVVTPTKARDEGPER